MSDGTQGGVEDSTLYKKITILAKVLERISVFSDRWLFIFLSVCILTASYLLAPFLVGSALVTKGGTVVTILGLLLSIKHSFFVPNSDVKKALENTESDGSSFTLKWEGVTYSLHNMEKTYKRLADEVSGFSLIIVGTLFAAYGDLLPFYKLMPVTLCGG
jgi:L-lactate permease